MQDGAQGLTMRGLGQDLGVEAMSLYRYVNGREDLLEAVVTVLLERLRRQPRRRTGSDLAGLPADSGARGATDRG